MLNKTYNYNDMFSVEDFNEIIYELKKAIELIINKDRNNYLYFKTLYDEIDSVKVRSCFDIMNSDNINKVIEITNILSEYSEIGERVEKKVVPGDVLDPNVINTIISIINKVQEKWQK